MRLLLDTHSYLWFVAGSALLSNKARAVMLQPGNTIFLSMASALEIALKHSLGKLPLTVPLQVLIRDEPVAQGFSILDINADHLLAMAAMPFHHRDPFDRVIIAQGLVENLPIISCDQIFDAYQVRRIW